MEELNICTQPNWSRYERRRDFLKSQGVLNPSIPSELPKLIESRSLWSGRSESCETAVLHLSLQDIHGIEDSLENFKFSGADFNDISRHTFQLPLLEIRLRDIYDEVHYGKGYYIVRGLNPEKYSLRDNNIIYAGLASHIADLRGAQSREKDILFHVCISSDDTILDPRPNATSEPLPYHNDSCEVIGLYTMETAKSGGEMLWASVAQIYNELSANRPEVIQVLAAQDWPFQTASEPPSVKRHSLLHFDDHGPFFWFSRLSFTGTGKISRPVSIPSLTLQQADALDALHYAAEKHALQFTSQKGDICFINNFSILHGRKAFENSSQDDGRHLIRLWLRDSAVGRKVPPEMEHRWNDVFNAGAGSSGKWQLSKHHAKQIVSHSLHRQMYADETTQTSV